MRLLLFLPLLLSAAFSYSQVSFEAAYSTNSLVPEGLLEAVAWTNTHMVHLSNQQESCSGYPQAYGIMGLHDNGLNYFIENGNLVAELSGISIADQKNSPQQQINAYASAFQALMSNAGATNPNDAVKIRQTLHQLSEIPDSGIVNLMARDIQVYSILEFMCSQEKAAQYGFTAHHINMSQLFGDDNYAVLSSNKIQLTQNGIHGDNGVQFQYAQALSVEYGPAIWNPAASCNYSSRNGTAISAITIHTVQGTYAGCISWFQNCSASVSAHYVVRSSDGQVTQMVLEADKAWHVGTENPYTIGYEHEGYVNDPSWYTEAMYNSSADLSRDIVNSGYGIPPLRTFYGDATAGINTIGGCTKIKGHQHYPNQTHTDPGINWDWEKYYRLINNNPAVTQITSTSGGFYDTGGAGGNYTDDERELWLIQPANVSSITLDFTAFDLEIDYDYLFLYDGDTIGAPLIGKYTGTNSPGTVTSSGGSLLVEFRSDCSTTAPGWEANYTSVPFDNNPPTTAIVPGATWHTTDFTVDFTDQDAESGVADKFYLITEKELTANDQQSNGTFGFAYETFEDGDNNWYPVTGTYSIASGSYAFTDTNEQNSNTYLTIDQQSSYTYLYEWNQTITSSASSQRAGIHFFCDDPNQSNRGNSYFVYLRANDDKLQIYSVSNNSFTLEVDEPMTVNEGQSYLCKVSYNPANGWIKVYVDDVFITEWQDATPLTSGNSISLRTGGCTAEFDNIKVYKSRSNQVLVTAGTNDEMSIESENATPTGFIHSVVVDSMENWSSATEESYLLDFTVPEIVYLNDGNGADIDTFTTPTLESNYQATDIHSGIQEYEIAVGTLPNLDDVYPWTSNGIAETFSTILSNPVYNQVYHVSIRAINNAGLSELFISNGQRYIDDLGITEEMLESVEIYPNPASDEIRFKNSPATFGVFVYDAAGQLILKKSMHNNEVLDIRAFAQGSYNVLIQYEDMVIVKPFIK